MQQFCEEIGAPVDDIQIERLKALEALYEYEKEQYQKAWHSEGMPDGQ